MARTQGAIYGPATGRGSDRKTMVVVAEANDDAGRFLRVVVGGRPLSGSVMQAAEIFGAIPLRDGSMHATAKLLPFQSNGPGGHSRTGRQSPSKTRRWRATRLTARPRRLSPSSAGRPQTSALITATFVRLSLRSVSRPKTSSWLQLSRCRVSRFLALSIPRYSLFHATTTRPRGVAAPLVAWLGHRASGGDRDSLRAHPNTPKNGRFAAGGSTHPARARGRSLMQGDLGYATITAAVGDVIPDTIPWSGGSCSDKHTRPVCH